MGRRCFRGLRPGFRHANPWLGLAYQGYLVALWSRPPYFAIPKGCGFRRDSSHDFVAPNLFAESEEQRHCIGRRHGIDLQALRHHRGRSRFLSRGRLRFAARVCKMDPITNLVFRPVFQRGIPMALLNHVSLQSTKLACLRRKTQVGLPYVFFFYVEKCCCCRCFCLHSCCAISIHANVLCSKQARSRSGICPCLGYSNIADHGNHYGHENADG